MRLNRSEKEKRWYKSLTSELSINQHDEIMQITQALCSDVCHVPILRYCSREHSIEQHDAGDSEKINHSDEEDKSMRIVRLMPSNH